MGFLSKLLSPITDIVTTYQKNRTKLKEKKMDVQLAKLNAEIKRFDKAIEIEADWDMEAMRQSQFSWKDEYLLLVLSAPFIGSFVPGVQDHVVKGWTYVAKAPLWYQTAFLGVIAATFGLRWWFNKNNTAIKKSKGL